jgi:oxygen-dependent protoporphyrinogen oxidase
VMISGVPGDAQQIAEDALKRHLGIQHPPDVVRVTPIHRAIPQYRIGHHERVSRFMEEARARYPNLTILGNHFHGVSVNDCISCAIRG